MSPFFYAVQQRVLAVDCALPFLTPIAEAAPDMSVILTQRAAPPRQSSPWYRSDEGADATRIDRADDAFAVRFADGTAFLVSADGTEIGLLSAPDAYGVADLATYALGPVLAFALHLQGRVLLHASAVVLSGKGVLFCGPSGAGKSTTAAMLAQQGYEILSDDLTVVSDTPPHQVLPSGGLLRLWSDSVESLYGHTDALPQFAPSWNKKILALAAGGQTRTIAAILLLTDLRRSSEPRIERLSPKAAWMRLMADAFTAKLPDGLMSGRIFDVMTSLANSVPIFAFTPPHLDHSDSLGGWLERALDAELR